MTDAEFAERAKQLFYDHCEHFGLTDADWPDDAPQEKQIEFEDQFRDLICEHEGHDLVPDQCGKYEHDFCGKCSTRRDKLTGTIRNDYRVKAD